ncbi:MAG: hypothetical protein JWP01_1233 [Myxococcales bacterium]|nr:hypothetical protein [Myxococcales bacterium]
MKSVAAVVLALVACNDSSSMSVDAPPPTDAAVDGSACSGACRTTRLTATFGSVQRSLDRAYYGITKTATGSTLHVEVYKGGGTGCPTMGSPTPQYTLVLARVPIPSDTTAVTSPGTLLDFVGDLLNGAINATATAVTLTPVANDVCPTCVGMAPPSDADGFIAFDATLTFSGGTITGHVFATHCDELDEQQ